MNEELYRQWKKDEKAPFEGWDFAYLKNRWAGEQPPWDYKEIASALVKNATAVLGMGTGGGEVLATLAPFPKYTVATEGYPPNVQIARTRLEPLGVKEEFGAELKHKDWSLSTAKEQIERVGFLIDRAEEWSGKVEFQDVGAVVYFLKVIPWIIEGFSVDKHLPILEKMQKWLEKNGKLSFTRTRFVIQAQKPV